MNNVTNNLESRKKVIELLKEISKYINSVRDALCEPYGLTSIQSIIILDIYNNPDFTKVTDICKRLNKSTNTISPLINRLIEKDFLYKEKDKIDQRVSYVRLTKKCEDILNNIIIDINDFTWPIFDLVSDDEFNQIYNSLNLLSEVIKK